MRSVGKALLIERDEDILDNIGCGILVGQETNGEERQRREIAVEELVESRSAELGGGNRHEFVIRQGL